MKFKDAYSRQYFEVDVSNIKCLRYATDTLDRTIIEFKSPIRDENNFLEYSIIVSSNIEEVKKLIDNQSFNNSFEDHLLE